MDLLDYNAVSEMTGLSVQSLMQYKSEGKMPPPDAIISNRSPVWQRKTIEKWMRDAQKPRGFSAGM